jgi:hypothetical protein
VAALVLLGLCAAIVLAGASADRATAARAKTLGKTKDTPASYCPKPRDFCESVGRVTGFQVKAAGEKNPFVVPRSGRLVAWSLDLTARPDKVERKFFGKLYGHKPFGATPTARLAVLTKRKGKKFRLRSQSPVVQLGEHLGQKPIFTLGRPLRVAKGDIVALTMPTWMSAFSVCSARPRGGGCRGLSRKQNKWRASRRGDRCELGNDNAAEKEALRKSRPHEQEGTSRPYGCTYQSARLLYWAYYQSG